MLRGDVYLGSLIEACGSIFRSYLSLALRMSQKMQCSQVFVGEFALKHRHW